MKISVCIPAYNRPDTIKQTIQSVIDQTEKDWELIVTDDSDNKNVESVVISFSDPRIRYTKNPNRLGMEGNWNMGLTLAKGQYIKLLMDDDYLHPTCLAEQALILDQLPRVVLVCADYEVVNGENQHIKMSNMKKDPYRLFLRDYVENGFAFILAYLLGKRKVGLPSAMLFRKSTLAVSGLVNPNAGFAADSDLWLRLCEFGDFAYCDKKLLVMRWHETNLSKKLVTETLGYQSILQLYRKWLQNDDPGITSAQAAIGLSAVARILPYYRNSNKNERKTIAKEVTMLPLSLIGRIRVKWWFFLQKYINY